MTDFCAERGLCVHEFALADLGDYSLRNGGNEPYRSSSDEERYAELCTGCEGNEWSETRLLRSS